MSWDLILASPTDDVTMSQFFFLARVTQARRDISCLKPVSCLMPGAHVGPPPRRSQPCLSQAPDSSGITHARTVSRAHARLHVRTYGGTHSLTHGGTYARMHGFTYARTVARMHTRWHVHTVARTHARTHGGTYIRTVARTHASTPPPPLHAHLSWQHKLAQTNSPLFFVAFHQIMIFFLTFGPIAIYLTVSPWSSSGTFSVFLEPTLSQL